jgi:hypothetical protein
VKTEKLQRRGKGQRAVEQRLKKEELEAYRVAGLTQVRGFIVD